MDFIDSWVFCICYVEEQEEKGCKVVGSKIMEYVAGVNTRTLPTMFFRDIDFDAPVYAEGEDDYSRGKTEIKSVLVVKKAGCYVVKQGIGTEEFVRKNGFALTFEEAILRFPYQFVKDQYESGE